MISLEKSQILTPLQNLSKNVGDLGKLLLPKALKSCPKSNKSPDLLTLVGAPLRFRSKIPKLEQAQTKVRQMKGSRKAF